MSLLARFLRTDRVTRASLSDLTREPWLDLPSHVEDALTEIRTQARSLGAGDLREAWAAYRSHTTEADRPYEITSDGTAVIHLNGHLLKEVPCAMWFFGITATSTVAVRHLLRTAMDDPEVQSIALIIDSPGGSLSGLEALAHDIFHLRDIKPIYGYAPDLACSAAYWIGAQCTRFTCGTTATIGSIGVYVRIPDLSEAFANHGVKIHVISSGPRKGDFVEGAPVTEAALAREQELVDEVRDMFVEAVARGRGLDTKRIRKLATGDVWHAEEALTFQLVDAIESDDDFLSALNTQNRAAAHTEETMSFDRILASLNQLTEEQRAQLQTRLSEPKTTQPDIPDEIAQRLAALEARNAELENERKTEGYKSEATNLKLVPNASTTELAGLLQDVDEKLDDAHAETLRNIFASVQASLKTSALFEAKGSKLGDETAAPLDQLNAIAKRIQESNTDLSFEDAFVRACELHPELYEAHNGDVRHWPKFDRRLT